MLIEVETSGCKKKKNEIKFLEHVQLFTTIEYTRRGDLHVNLTSPSGKKIDSLIGLSCRFTLGAKVQKEHGKLR